MDGKYPLKLLPIKLEQIGDTNTSEVFKNSADITTVTTFLEHIVTRAMPAPDRVREAATRLGQRAMAHAMQQDIRAMAEPNYYDRMPTRPYRNMRGGHEGHVSRIVDLDE